VRSRVRNPARARDFPFPIIVHTSSAALQCPSYSMGPRVLTCGVEGPRVEATHLPPSTAKVKDGWSYIYILPLYAFICVDGTTLPFSFARLCTL